MDGTSLAIQLAKLVIQRAGYLYTEINLGTKRGMEPSSPRTNKDVSEIIQGTLGVVNNY